MRLLEDGHVLLVSYADLSVSLFDLTSGTTSDSLGHIAEGELIALPHSRFVSIGASSALIYEVRESALQPLERHDFGSTIWERSAVLLRDGNILIAGGESFRYWALATSEALLYDPLSGTVRRTGDLPQPQTLFGMAALNDGTVLTMGGYVGHPGGDDYWAPPAIYDPSLGRFTPVPFLPPNYHTTLLPDGRVLLSQSGYYSGLWSGVGGAAPTAMLYIPAARAVSAASFGGRLAPGSLATLFGPELTERTEAAETFSPFPTSLGGVSLRVSDAAGREWPAGLLLASPSQINFEVPAGVATGEATLLLRRGDQEMTVMESIASVSPGLFAYADKVAIGYGHRVEPDGSASVLSTREPIALDDRPVFLVLYGTGIRNRTSLANIFCTIGGIKVQPTYAGPDGGGIPGLDQVNVPLPIKLRGRGAVSVMLTADGDESNTVTIDLR
jgi:uncharacterized protein (TIGR03437 family)